MLQGGDPSGDGSGGESAWGIPFKDEFDSRLLHDRRGIVSMANSGTNSNGSQFFITFKATPHLNNRHAVFGSVVGGMQILDQIEEIDTDQKDRPRQEIKIMKAAIFASPLEEADGILLEQVRTAMDRRKATAMSSALPTVSAAAPTKANSSGRGSSSIAKPGIGKYLASVASETSTAIISIQGSTGKRAGVDEYELYKKKKKLSSTSLKKFGDFSSW